jgi:hypothetical protein
MIKRLRRMARAMIVSFVIVSFALWTYLVFVMACWDGTCTP